MGGICYSVLGNIPFLLLLPWHNFFRRFSTLIYILDYLYSYSFQLRLFLQVLEVTRRGDLAVHFLTEEVQPGDKLVQKIDWVRRFDNMQQHSGKTLLNIFSKCYNVIVNKLCIISWTFLKFLKNIDVCMIFCPSGDD